MRLYLLQRNTYYNIFAAFVNNRKCDCDEFKCVNWIRKSSLSGSRYCTVSSIWCSCFTDIIVFLIGTDYNPQQSSYYVLNWTFFSHSHVMHMSACYSNLDNITRLSCRDKTHHCNCIAAMRSAPHPDFSMKKQAHNLSPDLN
jgi:hypothetical protein